jgi:hypothetical protein
MQSLPVYLYPNTLDVILDLDPTVQGVNRTMYQRDLKIQKGIKNKIRIQFKNSDQKRLPISNTATYVFNMFDADTQQLVIEKQLEVLDDSVVVYQSQDQGAAGNTLTFADTSDLSVGQTVTGFGISANTIVSTITGTNVILSNPTTVALTSSTSLTFNTLSLRGVGQLTLLESDTVDLETNSYKFSIVYRDPEDGTFLPTYADTYYGIPGTVYLNNDVFPILQPSQEIVSFLKSFNSQTNLYEHKSGNVYAYPEYNGNTALHTMALYMTGFKGTVYIQGTLYNSPQSLGRYVTVATLNYNGFTGIDYQNFNGIFSYVRVMYVPAVNPVGSNGNDDPAFYGSFDKVLYRS